MAEVVKILLYTDRPKNSVGTEDFLFDQVELNKSSSNRQNVSKLTLYLLIAYSDSLTNFLREFSRNVLKSCSSQYSLLSHWSPFQPIAQAQLYFPFVSSMQVPPFKHGLESQAEKKRKDTSDKGL